jgi:hypothetical protein
MNFYTPQATYSGANANSFFKTSFSNNYSPVVYVQAEQPEQPEPSDLPYDDFKAAVVALGLRNRLYDLVWEKNTGQLQSAVQQAQLQSVDHTCIAILFDCLSNQREEINFLKNIVYSVGKSMLNQKASEDSSRKKEAKRVERAAAAAERKKQKKERLVVPLPPPPPLKLNEGKLHNLPNVDKLLSSFAAANQNCHQPKFTLKTKLKKNN